MSGLYNRIESLCNEKNESITTMCKKSGVSRASLSDLKMGRNQSLSADTLSKIGTYFDVSVDYLLTGRVDPDCTPDDENPHELELRDTFDTLDVDDQIFVKNWVNSFAKNPQKAKNASTGSGERSISDDDIKFALFGGDGEITDAMYDEVRKFAAFVKQREADKKKE